VSKEREEIKVTTGTPVKSQAQIDADAASNTGEQNDEPEAQATTADQNKARQYADAVVNIDMTRAEMKARLVQVLERGIVHDRMLVPLPADVHGEWARNDPLEIARMQTLGFEVDYEYAPRRALHSDGTGAAIVGDVIFMTCPRIIKEVIDEIRHEQFIRLNAPSQTKEDKEMIANTLRSTGSEIGAFSESTTHIATEDDIRDTVREALNKVAQQTQPAPV
jgi:hypothetical protein